MLHDDGPAGSHEDVSGGWQAGPGPLLDEVEQVPVHELPGVLSVRRPGRYGEAVTSTNGRIRALGIVLLLVAVAGGVGALHSKAAVPVAKLLGDERDVIVVYDVDDRALVDPVIAMDGPLARDRAAHEAAWATWLAVAPPIWAHRIDHLVIATDGPGGTYGAMWAYRSRRALLIDPADTGDLRNDLTSTMVHELAHLVVMQDGEPSRLEAGELPVTPLGPGCVGRALVVKCADPASILGRFAQEFWSDEALRAAAVARTSADRVQAVVDLYLTDTTAYVTPYAASSPDEDIAETFAAIVLGTQPRSGTVAAAKADWLRAQPAIADLVMDLTAVG